jgi:hypothetical protein
LIPTPTVNWTPPPFWSWKSISTIAPRARSRGATLQGLKKTLKQDALFFTAPEELPPHQGGIAFAKETKPRLEFLELELADDGDHQDLATACLALLLTLTLTRPSAEQRLTQEIVSSHIRSLMADHMLDVVSTDQHTVKPWFNGKLDFSPPVKDLAAQEFPLIGGRLDYHRRTQRGRARFSSQQTCHQSFHLAGEQKRIRSPPSLTPIQGYNVIHWTNAGMTFWAVSDLNEKELMEFVQDYAAAAPPKEH